MCVCVGRQTITHLLHIQWLLYLQPTTLHVHPAGHPSPTIKVPTWISVTLSSKTGFIATIVAGRHRKEFLRLAVIFKWTDDFLGQCPNSEIPVNAAAQVLIGASGLSTLGSLLPRRTFLGASVN